MQKYIASSLAALLLASQTIVPAALSALTVGTPATPIQHLVVIFGENISFDHYFGTYPNALNPAGEPAFLPSYSNTISTPTVNGYTPALLNANPNFLNPANGTGAANPFRLDRSQAATSDQGHNYTPEQEAFDHGLMDAFPAYTGTAGAPISTKGLVMGYYDGNTVTALWNYAQHYAMNDNSYGTTFGPSTPGAINLISGQTNGVVDQANAGSAIVPDGQGGYTLIGDADPVGDVCSGSNVVAFSGQNVGDLLNAANVTWGFFSGGFNLSTVNANGSTGCARSTTSSVTSVKKADYIPHHQPFQYYPSTANPQHLRPTGAIGTSDQANHQYDINDFYAAVKANNIPAVSFLKAPAFQDAHAGYSDPLDEQTFVVNVINQLVKSKDWASTAVIIAYDDSDGWYDHQLGQIVNTSATAADAISGPGLCGSGVNALPGVTAAAAQGRCGYGPRVPLLVISPYARENFVDHTLTDQSSILRFIEDNWLGGERITGSFDALAGTLQNMFYFPNKRATKLTLDPSTGLVVSTK